MNLAKKAPDTLPLDRGGVDSAVLPRPFVVNGYPPTEEERPGAGMGRLWKAFRYHWLVLAVMGTLVAGGFAWAAWNLIPSKYTTYALLRVSATEPFYVFPPDGQPVRGDF